jgi:predicted ArsR family transcriptional regulator
MATTSSGVGWGEVVGGVTHAFYRERPCKLGPVSDPAPTRLALLKALGDNTRYAIYQELVRSALPLSTADIAEVLDLHPNTVRPHLDRMREVGLLAVTTASRGGVGRPQHLYALAEDAPSLGLHPSPMALMARLLAEVVAASGAGSEDAAGIGRGQGHVAAAALPVAELDRLADLDDDAAACVEALTAELARLGFDPAASPEGEGACIAFTACPFAELAEAHPEIICHLHRGIVEGFVQALGGAEVASFATLADRYPCRVEVVPA